MDKWSNRKGEPTQLARLTAIVEKLAQTVEAYVSRTTLTAVDPEAARRRFDAVALALPTATRNILWWEFQVDSPADLARLTRSQLLAARGVGVTRLAQIVAWAKEKFGIDIPA